MNLPVPPHRISELASVELSPADQARVALACDTAHGNPQWKARMRAEATELLALATLAPRLEVVALAMPGDLRAILNLKVPVPCLPEEEGPLVIGQEAELVLIYPELALTRSLPGYAFLSLHAPRAAWHPNIARGPDQRLCLGASLPVGVPVREIVLLSYALLTLQAIQIDPEDSAGVLNREATDWYHANSEVIPLSKVPFLGTEDLGVPS